MDKIFTFFFSLLLLIWVAIVLLFFQPEPTAMTGQEHPVYKTMIQSGAQQEMLPVAKGLIFFIGIGFLGIFFTCLYIGIQKTKGKNPMKRPLLFSIGFVTATYILLVLFYRSYQAGTTFYFGGFPFPTAWMLAFIWLFPLFFTIVYIRYFDRWLFTTSDQQHFEQMLKEQSKSSAQ